MEIQFSLKARERSFRSSCMISMTIDIALLARKIESFDDITEGVPLCICDLRFQNGITIFEQMTHFEGIQLSLVECQRKTKHQTVTM